MLQDVNLLMSANQAVTSTADTEHRIDTLAAGDAIRPGARLRVTTKVAATDSGSDATLTFELKHSSDDVTYTTLYSTGALAFATYSAAGSIVADLVIPNGVRRYLKGTYTVGSGPLTAGKFDAAIMFETEKLIDRGL